MPGDPDINQSWGSPLERSERPLGGGRCQPVRALAYFSMGVGCDGCFAQIPEIDHALASRGIELLPVMVDPIDALAFEATRFGIERPILIDEDRSVSESYGMVGQFGHGDRPSHSFAFISSDGTTEPSNALSTTPRCSSHSSNFSMTSTSPDR